MVNCIFEDDKGNLWIGTQDGGVNKFDGIHITHYTTKEGLASNRDLDHYTGQTWRHVVCY